jgi:hypothetical protein
MLLTGEAARAIPAYGPPSDTGGDETGARLRTRPRRRVARRLTLRYPVTAAPLMHPHTAIGLSLAAEPL